MFFNQYFIMRKLVSFRVKDKRNSLLSWKQAKHPLVVLRNIILTEFCRYMPLSVKNILYKSIGVKIGKNAAISYKVRMDVVFPELVEIGENSIIGYNTTILCHEFLTREWRKGPVKIGKNVMIGANCTILAGVSIGDNSTVSAMTFVNSSIPSNSFACGNPVKIKRKIK